MVCGGKSCWLLENARLAGSRTNELGSSPTAGAADERSGEQCEPAWHVESASRDGLVRGAGKQQWWSRARQSYDDRAIRLRSERDRRNWFDQAQLRAKMQGRARVNNISRRVLKTAIVGHDRALHRMECGEARGRQHGPRPQRGLQKEPKVIG